MGREDGGRPSRSRPKIAIGIRRGLRLIPTLRDRLRWPSLSFKIFEVSREKLGFTQFSPIFPNFPRLCPTLPDFSRFFFTWKGWEKLRKIWDRASQHGPNFWTGRAALPDPHLDLSKSWDGHPDLNLDPTWPNFGRDTTPLEISRPYLMQRQVILNDKLLAKTTFVLAFPT